jgi:hypothetical protein
MHFWIHKLIRMCHLDLLTSKVHFWVHKFFKLFTSRFIYIHIVHVMLTGHADCTFPRLLTWIILRIDVLPTFFF